MLMPRQKTPALSLKTLDHGDFVLDAEPSERGTLVVFYRGLHCPICISYLKELDTLVAPLAERGIGTIAISTDDAGRARAMADKVGGENLRYGYGLSLQDARDWGLYISSGIGKTSIGVEEPAKFAEPGLFLVGPDRSLYFGSVQTMPFLRPPLGGLIGALDFVIAKNYPARGEVRDIAA